METFDVPTIEEIWAAVPPVRLLEVTYTKRVTQIKGDEIGQVEIIVETLN